MGESPGNFRSAPNGCEPMLSYQMPSTRSFTYQVISVKTVGDPLTKVILAPYEGRRALVVTTPTVSRWYGNSVIAGLAQCGLKCSLVIVSSGERSKSWETLDQICTAARSADFGRNDVLIPLGGGACSDVASVAGALFRRGVPVVRIPTTLIGQIDAAIGVKGAVNHRGKKNALGVYYPPIAVLIDTCFLATLDSRSIRNGLAEILKIAIVRDPALFQLVITEARQLIKSRLQRPIAEAFEVIRSAAIDMLDELRPNLFEDKSHQRLVDMGHTFSPLLESTSGYHLRHGEAVAIDTSMSASVATSLDLLSANDRDAILDAFLKVGLPIYSPYLTTRLCVEALREASLHRGGRSRLVLPTSIGSATFLDSDTSLADPVIEASITLLTRKSGAQLNRRQC